MKKFLLFLMAVLLFVGNLSAQTSTTVRWEGCDQSSLTDGEQVFLYNVGTGRFLIHGGDWGTQARLFYDDTGKLLTYNINNGNYTLNSGINTQGAGVIGVNVPNVTSSWTWEKGSEETFTIILDANATYSGNNHSGNRNLHFTRTSDNSTYTYYIYETLSDGVTYYWGSTYGENHDSHDGDANGEMVRLSSSYDKATWTTQTPGNFAIAYDESGQPDGKTAADHNVTNGDTEVPMFNVDTKVPLDELYQWRIVKLSDVLAQLNDYVQISDGLSSNLTYLIADRGFERNDYDFYDNWKVGRLSDPETAYPTSGEYRYKYTWGYYDYEVKNNSYDWTQHQSGTTEEPWNAPVRLKSQFVSKADAKYGFMEFEGEGTAYTSLNISDSNLKSGFYKIGCYGWYQGSHPAYLFATTTDPTGADNTLSFENLTKSTAFEQVSGAPYDNESKANEGSVTGNSTDGYTKTGVMGAGYDFVYNKTPYYREVQIEVTSTNQTLYFGVVKKGATKSSEDESESATTKAVYYITSGSTNYMYRTESGDLGFTTNKAQALQWNFSNNKFSTEIEGTTYYLCYNGTDPNITAVLRTDDTNLCTYRNSSIYAYRTSNGNGRYTYYYMHYENNSISFSTSSDNSVTYSSETIQVPAKSYYHDTDWVGVDQFEIFYLGTDKPVLFDEDEESLTYLKTSETEDKQYNNRTVRLHRAFKKGKWNSFVFPLDMTAVQVRNAFGDDCKLMKLCDLGYISGYTHVLDFESVPLPAEGAAVEAGKFYLIQPTKDPSTPSVDDEKDYYTIGRYSFNTSGMNNIKSTVVGKATETKDGSAVIDDNPVTEVTTYATYIATTDYDGYSKAQIDDVSAVTNGVYAPAKAYVISDNKVYHIKTPTRIKGFRGWIMDTAAESQENPVKVFFNGEIVDDDMATEILEAIADAPIAVGGIYDLTGRRVQSDDLNALPKGLYIVNGKKMLVK